MHIRNLVLCALFVIPLRSQHPDVTQGATLFVEKCSACHGDTAKGGRGPDLTSGEWKHGSSDVDLMRNIISGIPGTQMPAISMSESDARLIVGFLRSAASSAS